eukprot:TRINITY_DN7945_c0_g1_i1.p1 TRINITY_DN7945_c0_g1~~TRINITY_DN7945_c0_g1_i1.p1  ORF type:complete len:107 (-),score=44.56 TRINITY_DN7945_c0_g1_i1:86-373(-)
MFLQHNNDPMEEEPPFDSEEGMGAAEAEGDNEEIAEEELTEDENAEFSVLNRQLDQLDQALDAIEHKNDNIHDKLRELLEESRQARLEIEASKQQ